MRFISLVALIFVSLSFGSYACYHPLQQDAELDLPKQSARVQILEKPKPTPRVEILEDYEPQSTNGNELTLMPAESNDLLKVVDTVPTAPDANMLAVVRHRDPRIQEDYGEEHDEIELKKAVAKPPEHILLRTSKYALWAGYKIADHTTRIFLGCVSNYMFNQAASVAVGTGFYALTLYLTGGNVFVANFMYAFGAQTLQPITAALVFYAGAHTPDIIYYLGKGVFKTVHLASKAAILLFQGVKYTGDGIATLVWDQKKREEMIEMVKLHEPMK